MGEMKVVPKKKLIVTLWALIGFLFVLLFWLLFKLLVGPSRFLISIGVFLDFVLIIFLYIKSVLNYFEVAVEKEGVEIRRFGEVVTSCKFNEVKFSEDNTVRNKKVYRRIHMKINKQNVVISNLEHDGFEEFQKILLVGKKI
jgi:hypothetical protein